MKRRGLPAGRSPPAARGRLAARRRGSILAVVLAGALLAPPPCRSQPRLPPLQTPARRFAPAPRPELAEPEQEPPLRHDERILPPIETDEAPFRLGRGVRVQVLRFRIEGNRIFDDRELQAVVAPWVGRSMSSEQLQAIRDALTAYYVERGYVNSGALIPDQSVEHGTIRIRIVEGRLGAVRVEGTRHFARAYFERRLLLDAGEPLRIQRLERRLRILRQDPRIRRIRARLAPGDVLGEAVLRVRIDESPPLRLAAEWSNDTPVSLGEQTGRLALSLANPIGLGDDLEGRLRLSEGLLEYEAHYRLPWNRWDGEISLRYQASEGRIVEEPFRRARIETDAQSAALALAQPLYRSPQTDARISLLGEWRRAETRVDGRGFGFPGSGADPQSGRSQLAVLRLGTEWIQRTRERVLVARQLVSLGLPVLGASQNPTGVPDGRFLSFLTQLRAALRLPWLAGGEIVARGDLQWATLPLMPLEQIAAGGLHSVRGYAENELVRDQAAVASLEIRLPLYRSSLGDQLLQIAPFVDVAHGWNRARSSAELPSRTLLGLGAGLRYRLRRRLSASLYWAAALGDARSASDTAQGHGLHFRLRLDLP